MTQPDLAVSTPKWIKIVLALSLGANLAILGIVAGAMLKDGHRGRDGVARETNFGPFTEALTREDRRALRDAFLEKSPDLRDAKRSAQADLDTLLKTLRQQPFDPATLEVAMTAIQKRNEVRLDLGRTLILDRLLKMSEQDRLAFADRLEKNLTHGDQPPAR